jgi:hypothetical protein
MSESLIKKIRSESFSLPDRKIPQRGEDAPSGRAARRSLSFVEVPE